MSIAIKSNRSFMVKLSVSLLAIGILPLIGMTIAFAVDYEGQKGSLPVLIFFIAYCAVFVAATLFIEFWNGRRYEFGETEIICYKRKKLLDKIDVSDILQIAFYKFKLRYIVPLFLTGDALREGYWTLHIALRDGTKKTLRFFSIKDVELLKEKLYGQLVSIG